MAGTYNIGCEDFLVLGEIKFLFCRHFGGVNISSRALVICIVLLRIRAESALTFIDVGRAKIRTS